LLTTQVAGVSVPDEAVMVTDQLFVRVGPTKVRLPPVCDEPLGTVREVGESVPREGVRLRFTTVVAVAGAAFP
jgi:hypothetical protein